jgi:hypothetical protein
VFCGNCGSAIVNISPGLGDSQAIQTGNFADFANVPITTESEYFSFFGIQTLLVFLESPRKSFIIQKILVGTDILAVFVKDRWAGLEPIHDADQVPAMPANVQDLAT